MKSRKLNISHFLLLVFLCSLFFVSGCTEEESAAEPVAYEIITKVEGYGDAEFDQISPGMSLGQLNQIIGFEGELMGSSKEGDTVYETYQWQLNKEASLSGDFEDEIVVLFSGWNSRDGYREVKQASNTDDLTALEVSAPDEEITNPLPLMVIGTNNQPEGLGSSSGFAADLLVEILELSGYTIEFQTFDSWEEETAALTSNNVDVLLDMGNDGPFLYSETYHSVHTDELFYAVAVGEYQLADEINQGIEELKDNGTYREIFIEYFGEENYES